MPETGQRAPLAGVVFDLDGTLYDKRALERFMIQRMLRSLPRLHRYTKTRSSLAGVDMGTAEALREETLARLARTPRRRRSWQRWIDERYDPMVRQGMIHAVSPYPGVRALLSELRDAGLRLGLVSDYRGIEPRLSALGLHLEAFDFTLVTEEQGAMKPAPRIVRRTLQGMGLPGESMVMVGDRAFTDLAFAEAAGMDFVGVLPVAPSTPVSDPRWRTWARARAYLLEIARKDVPASPAAERRTTAAEC